MVKITKENTIPYSKDRENKIRKHKFKENIKQMTSVRPNIPGKRDKFSY